MNVSAMALPRYRVPSAKTIGISLLQAVGFAVMLYFAALICAVVSTAFGEHGCDQNIQAIIRWSWILPAPFYALAIGSKIAAEALGRPSLVNSLWLRTPTRIVFSIPTLLLVVLSVVSMVAAFKTTQEAAILASTAMSVSMTAGSTVVVYVLYILKLRCFKDKPVADALFVSFLPVLPTAVTFLGQLAIAIAAIPLIFIAAACSTRRL